MRKIKLYTVVSSDGYVSCPGGSIEWIYEIEHPPRIDWDLETFFRETDLVVMTRSHYSMLLACDALHRYLERTCVIIKREFENDIPDRSDAKHIVINDDDYSPAIECVSGVRQEEGGDIWLAGDHKLIHAFLEAGLVDEITLTLLPVELGRGIKLFPVSFDQDDWVSTKIKEYQNGAVQIQYRSSGYDTEVRINQNAS